MELELRKLYTEVRIRKVEARMIYDLKQIENQDRVNVTDKKKINEPRKSLVRNSE